MLDKAREEFVSNSPSLSTNDRPRFPHNLSAAIVMSVAAILSLSALFWTVREKVLPLSANSEFFAFSWVYALRWGAGEYVFQPHGQLTFPIFSLIDKALGMTEGSPEQIISGWHGIAFYWPLAIMVLSLAILFSTASREHRLTDAIFSAAVYVASVPLFLTDFAIGSMAYHSLSIPLALAGLPFWSFYKAPDRQFNITFYVMLGIYAAVCVLGKPTFIAFAAPFFAMELIKSIRGKNFVGVIVAGAVAASLYLLWLLLFYGSISGVADHFSQTLYFMQSQADWYDNEKGATPFHWYAVYIVGKMGPLPSVLIVASILLPFARKARFTLLVGIISAIGCALFCLHARSQLHAHPEFVALLATTTIAAFRCSGLPALLDEKLRPRINAYTVAALAVILLVAKYPLPTIQHDFTVIMSEYDAIAVPALFQQPEGVKTIALMKYPDMMWGAADAWCRGSGNIFNASRSDFLAKKFGNVTCLFNQESRADLFGYNYALLVKPVNVTNAKNLADLSVAFPATTKRLKNCHSIGIVVSDGAEFIRCELSN